MWTYLTMGFFLNHDQNFIRILQNFSIACVLKSKNAKLSHEWNCLSSNTPGSGKTVIGLKQRMELKSRGSVHRIRICCMIL